MGLSSSSIAVIGAWALFITLTVCFLLPILSAQKGMRMEDLMKRASGPVFRVPNRDNEVIAIQGIKGHESG
jgi:hypothetical protein